MFGLRLMFVFFGFLQVFCFFGYDLEKIKKIQGFFGFLKELLLEVRQKNKKKLRFFLVFGQIFRKYVIIIHAKKKRPDFFWLFTIL